MKLIACPAHGWEYDMETGQSWIDPTAGKARAVDLTVESGGRVAQELSDGSTSNAAAGGFFDPKTRRIKGPYTAEVIPVEVEDEYVVISLAGRRIVGKE